MDFLGFNLGDFARIAGQISKCPQLTRAFGRTAKVVTAGRHHVLVHVPSATRVADQCDVAVRAGQMVGIKNFAWRAHGDDGVFVAVTADTYRQKFQTFNLG